MHHVYVLWSKKNSKFYIGYTTDLARRMSEHECGKVYSTKRLSDCRLIFYETFISKEDAFRRERYFKTTKGKKALKLVLRSSIA